MRTLLPLSALMLALSLACSNSSKPSEPAPAPPAPAPAAPAPAAPAPAPAAPAPAPTAAAPAAPPAPTELKCCSDAHVKEMVVHYLDAQELLAKDDYKAASQLSAVRGNAMAAEKALTDKADVTLLQKVEADAKAGMDTKDLDQQRKAFKGLSESVIAIVKKYPGGDLDLREAYCPMYPGSWLQRGKTIANPYYGTKMPTCGSFR